MPGKLVGNRRVALLLGLPSMLIVIGLATLAVVPVSDTASATSFSVQSLEVTDERPFRLCPGNVRFTDVPIERHCEHDKVGENVVYLFRNELVNPDHQHRIGDLQVLLPTGTRIQPLHYHPDRSGWTVLRLHFPGHAILYNGELDFEVITWAYGKPQEFIPPPPSIL